MLMEMLEAEVRNYMAKAVHKELPKEILLQALYEALEPMVERIDELSGENEQLKQRIITLTENHHG